MSATVIIHIRVRADLLPEPFDDRDPRIAAAFCAAASQGCIDGGLDIVADGARLSWPDIWDHVDGMLLAWLVALGEVLGGATEAVATFPDTRVECELRHAGDNRVHIEYEDIAATVALQTLNEAVTAAAQRLVGLARCHGLSTSALAELATLLEQAACLEHAGRLDQPGRMGRAGRR